MTHTNASMPPSRAAMQPSHASMSRDRASISHSNTFISHSGASMPPSNANRLVPTPARNMQDLLSSAALHDASPEQRLASLVTIASYAWLIIPLRFVPDSHALLLSYTILPSYYVLIPTSYFFCCTSRFLLPDSHFLRLTSYVLLLASYILWVVNSSNIQANTHKNVCKLLRFGVYRRAILHSSCDSAARGGTSFHQRGRAGARKGTYWRHINILEMSPGDVSRHMSKPLRMFIVVSYILVLSHLVRVCVLLC